MGEDAKNKLIAAGVGAGCLGLIVMLVFGPVITFGLAYFGGWLLSLVVGNLVADGLNLIFDTTRFTPQLSPLTCAIFATIGRYFKSTQSNTNNAK